MHEFKIVSYNVRLGNRIAPKGNYVLPGGVGFSTWLRAYIFCRGAGGEELEILFPEPASQNVPDNMAWDGPPPTGFVVASLDEFPMYLDLLRNEDCIGRLRTDYARGNGIEKPEGPASWGHFDI